MMKQDVGSIPPSQHLTQAVWRPKVVRDGRFVSVDARSAAEEVTPRDENRSPKFFFGKNKENYFFSNK